ncbi:MAG TPA: hypothetical protein VJU77_02000 [Chthoniobacterales bacterium]|nr:hypothetical protein [Chthoniobacterales bacterium]
MHSTKIILVTAITVLAGAFSTLAAPINFNEVSLWVRAKETDKSIQNEVKERKLAKALTPQQESVLKSQGASDSLVQSLRSPAVIASAAEIAATEVKTPAPRNPAPTTQEPNTSESPADNLHVFEVASGHPVNLSQWGGPDTEFAFNVFRYAGENVVEPAIIDTVRTYTDVANYIGPIGSVQRTALPHFRGNRHLTPYLGGDLKDDQHLIGDYISAVSHSTSRGMSIDHKHPVYMKGIPYILYPVYGAGNTSLYYIGNTSSSVTLAIIAAR